LLPAIITSNLLSIKKMPKRAFHYILIRIR
jgi:hypothetical protein